MYPMFAVYFILDVQINFFHNFAPLSTWSFVEYSFRIQSNSNIVDN